jgi:hypothetical protein
MKLVIEGAKYIRSLEHSHGFELFTLRCTEVGQSLKSPIVHMIEPCSFLVHTVCVLEVVEGVEQTFDSRLNQRMGIRVSSVRL